MPQSFSNNMTEVPINWERLLMKVTPDNAMKKLREELGPSLLSIMEGIIGNLEQRRFLSMRQTVISLIGFLSEYEAETCLQILFAMKEDLLQLESIDQSVLRNLVFSASNLFMNLWDLLFYLQETFQIYSPEEEEVIQSKFQVLNLKLAAVSHNEEISKFSPKNWKDALIFS